MQNDHDNIRIDPRQLDRLLEDRGWPRTQLVERAGITPEALAQAEANGTAPSVLGRALATALDVPPALLAEASAEGRRYLEKRGATITFLLAVVFLLSLFFGYQIGSDFAAKANRADCIAAGGTDCG